MHFFRNHKRALLVFMFVAIGVPMVFFGIPWGGTGANPNSDVELARVGGVPVMASELYANLEAARRRMTQPNQDPPTFKDLHEQGMAGEMLDEMISSALIRREEDKRDFAVEHSLLEERLRDDPSFKDDTGTFIPSRYNAWVTSREGMDWTPVYQDVQERLTRQVYMAAILAAGNRVLDKDIQQELIDRSTKIQIEYLKVEPAVVPTDEEIQKEYSENQEAYREPDTYTVDYVAISLLPEPSEEVTTVLEKARAGEDFAALADEFSDLETKNGGDLDWLAEREIELDYRKPLFALAVGEVSEPVRGPKGFYIYKVDEERVNEETQQREVKARHIYIEVELSPEERQARMALAESIATKARESDSGLATVVATVEGAPAVQQAAGFSVETPEIAGIPNRDAFQFRRMVDEEARRVKEAMKTPAYPIQKDVTKLEYPVITGIENLYVAEFTGAVQGAVPPLEQVRDQVADDVIAKKKNSEEYKKEVEALAQTIKGQASTLDEVKEKFPQIDGDIKETRPFTKAEYLFQEQVYLQTPEIYETLADKEVNALAGPLTDFLGGTYFIALTNRQEPTEEDKANWDEEGKQLREQRIQMAQAQLLQDYLADLRERELQRLDWTINWDVYNRILGIDAADTEAEEPAGPLTVELPDGDSPADSAPADEASEPAAEAPAEATPDAPATAESGA